MLLSCCDKVLCYCHVVTKCCVTVVLLQSVVLLPLCCYKVLCYCHCVVTKCCVTAIVLLQCVVLLPCCYTLSTHMDVLHTGCDFLVKVDAWDLGAEFPQGVVIPDVVGAEGVCVRLVPAVLPGGVCPTHGE